MPIGEPKIISEEKQTFTDVPVLKFIGNEAVVVFFEGRPEVATIMGKFRKYRTPKFPDGQDPYLDTYDMYHINAYPGFTATIIKEKMTIVNNWGDKDKGWVLTAKDIKYERP